MAAGGAPSATKTGSAGLTSGAPGIERVLELLPVLGDQGLVTMAGVIQAQVVMGEAMLALLEEGLQCLI